MDKCKWLPKIVECKDYTKWNEYLDIIYEIFKNDFIDNKPIFEGKNVMEMGIENVPVISVVVGTAAAAVSGFFAVKFMLNLIQRKKLFGFALYVAILGIWVILDQNIFHLVF